MVPVVAIIGRTNVGKSTLFNRLLRKNKALTHDQPGVTRDRIYGRIEDEQGSFDLVDTGGIDFENGRHLEPVIFEQAREAIREATLILLVTDGRAGLTALDAQLGDFVRKANKRVHLVVNKVDGPELEDQLSPEFYSLGLEVSAVSSAHGYGVASLIDRIQSYLAPEWQGEEGSEQPEFQKGLKLALLGRPNVGKSSIINALAGKERLIVSREAGTTRDSIDVALQSDNTRYVFMDTAGVRKKSRVHSSLERFSVIRALKSSQRADVTIMVLDASQEVGVQDKKLLAHLLQEKAPLIIALNKVDLVPKKHRSELNTYFNSQFRFCAHVPVIFTSSVNKAGLGGILPLAEKLWQECQKRVATGELNRTLKQITGKMQPPVIKGRRPKFYYLTQAGTVPPTFVFFMNDHSLLKSSYERYLERQIRKVLGFHMAPIQLVFRTSQG